MTPSTARKWDPRLGLAWVALAWAVLSAVAGCASSPGATPTSPDMLTESDEPDLHFAPSPFPTSRAPRAITGPRSCPAGAFLSRTHARRAEEAVLACGA